MRAVDLIWKKRRGESLTREELEFLINGFLQGEIPDYQISAWCMAVCFQGMSFEECADFTLTMAYSGKTIDLSTITGVKVDKHSTGGVGDKTSLILLPLVAACGVPVAKMSGRGLGHTGGTIDKLESIPGFRTKLPNEEFIKQVQDIGIALIGQTDNLVPADKKLYALRDVTATVESIPLIASSIVSKKLAAGADAVLLDVKFGEGAFISDYQQAQLLAETMVEIGNRSGKHFIAVLSDMTQPLGSAIGNSLEVIEAIETLKNKGPKDLTNLCLKLGGYMVWLGQLAENPEIGQQMVTEALVNGKGLAKFNELIKAQGGHPDTVENINILPQAPIVKKLFSNEDGWIDRVDCRALGVIAMKLGAGRNKIEDEIRMDVGLRLKIKPGMYFSKQTVLAEIHAGNEIDAENAMAEISKCLHITHQPVEEKPLIASVIL
jgi:pyrimidine-nucleoside phosphorylase